MNNYLASITILFSFCFGCINLCAQANQDYFKIHSGALPVKIFVGQAAKAGTLLGLDGQKGIIYASMDGAGRMQLELRGLETVSYTHLTLPTNREV